MWWASIQYLRYPFLTILFCIRKRGLLYMVVHKYCSAVTSFQTFGLKSLGSLMHKGLSYMVKYRILREHFINTKTVVVTIVIVIIRNIEINSFIKGYPGLAEIWISFVKKRHNLQRNDIPSAIFESKSLNLVLVEG